MKTLSVVIPALNEEHGIGDVLKEIPIKELKKMGYETEVLVIDNGSEDQTQTIARKGGAKVIVQPIRGYGNAYKAGFANANGDVIATGDADMTYPFSILPEALKKLENENIDFLNTDRLTTLRKEVMEGSHVFGNWLLTFGTKALFKWPYKDSQSGMWIFKRPIWNHLDVRSSGMPFSQELKIEAFSRGFKCAEIPIDYRARAGEVKLNTISDGLGNITHLVRKRVQLGIRASKADIKQVEREWSAIEKRRSDAREKKEKWETVKA
jgi:glycosyltransferase involved in cell wall biosynthesis